MLFPPPPGGGTGAPLDPGGTLFYVDDVGRTGPPVTTQWSAYLQEDAAPAGTAPLWATAFPSIPDNVIYLQSPLGAGSTLERCEVYVAASATYDALEAEPDWWQVDSLSLIISGEVYNTLAPGNPDPRTSTDSQFVITGAATLQTRYPMGGGYSYGGATWSTEGYLQSRAKRGPDHYGGGVPELVVSVYAAPIFTPGWTDHVRTSGLFHARALWSI